MTRRKLFRLQIKDVNSVKISNKVSETHGSLCWTFATLTHNLRMCVFPCIKENTGTISDMGVLTVDDRLPSNPVDQDRFV